MRFIRTFAIKQKYTRKGPVILRLSFLLLIILINPHLAIQHSLTFYKIWLEMLLMMHSLPLYLSLGGVRQLPKCWVLGLVSSLL